MITKSMTTVSSMWTELPPCTCPSTYTHSTDLQARTASITKSFRCLNVLGERASPTKTGGRIDIRYTSVVGEGTEGKSWWDHKEMSRLVSDVFGLGDGMGNSAFYFCGGCGGQWTGLLFYLPSQSSCNWYSRGLLIYVRSRLLQLKDAGTWVCLVKLGAEFGSFGNRAV